MRINAEISFKSPSSLSNEPENNPEDKQELFKKKRQEREKNNLQREIEKKQEKLKRLKTLASTIKIIALNLKNAQDPNDDPINLTRQINSLLTKMGLQNKIQNNKTRLVPGTTKKDKSLYEILLRREADITVDTIDRIKRNEDNFESIKWSSKSIIISLWAPYQVFAPAGTPGIL